MKVLTVVGARPQFVKAAVISKILRRSATEILVHTGQHYDFNLSELFFKELEIPEPDYNLEVGSGPHGAQTGKILEALEEVIIKEGPDLVLIYGDTNSTLAGVLAAVKLKIPVAHVEAGLRSFNRKMPEEINRVVADHLATWLLAPTATAVRNLAAEGIVTGVHLTGDVMYDAFLAVSKVARERSAILTALHQTPGNYSLLTLHRAENTDDPQRLQTIFSTLDELDQAVIFPIHPRTREKLKQFGIRPAEKALRMIEPVGYFDMLNLELNAYRIFTDSGGVQKEAYMAKVPCITLREETEWVETIEAKWNRLAGADPEAIMKAADLSWVGSDYPLLFGDGKAACKIIQILVA